MGMDTAISYKRVRAFSWCYDLVAEKHISEIGRHFPQDSETATALKIFLGYRVAIEMGMLYLDPTHHDQHVFSSIRKQLDKQINQLIRDSRNLALMRVFQFNGHCSTGEESKLRQTILLDLQMDFEYLREHVFMPEMDRMLAKEEIMFNWRNWWFVIVGVGLLSMGFIFNLAAWQVLLDPTVMAWTGGIIVTGLLIQWAMREIPVWYRSALLGYHYGQSYTDMKDHLNALNPVKPQVESGWWDGLFKTTSKGLDETWLSLDSWANTRFEVKKNTASRASIIKTPRREWLDIARKPTSPSVFSPKKGSPSPNKDTSCSKTR
jgi:hypothetical protein